MIDRRTTLKTLAGATVVGSLSGCAQLATQRTVEYHGTPALLSVETNRRPDYAVGVGVEARRTIERFGVEKEIVTHNWGMLYTVGMADQEARDAGAVATFTTPSINIAGQELNPIKDLTVGDIGVEILSITETSLGPNEEASTFISDVPVSDEGLLASASVEDATGRKVLREFRDSVPVASSNSSGGVDTAAINRDDHIRIETGQPIPEGEEAVGPTPAGIRPRWDGDMYNIRHGKMEEGRRTIRFDKHDDDFVVLFESRTVSGTEGDELELPINTDGNNGGFHHPPDDEFNEEMVSRHLVGTNLQGAQGMVEQSRRLIDETQDLIAEAKNDTRNEEDARFRTLTATEDDLDQLDTIMGDLGEDLQSLSVDTIIGGQGRDTIRRVQDRSEEAATIATRAHERVASYNDTRDVEDETLLALERKLEDLKKKATEPHLVIDVATAV